MDYEKLKKILATLEEMYAAAGDDARDALGYVPISRTPAKKALAKTPSSFQVFFCGGAGGARRVDRRGSRRGASVALDPRRRRRGRGARVV